MDQPDTRTVVKVAPQSKYRPKPMTDESVFDLAQHYYTFEEICEYFHVNANTLEAHHGEAFRAGKNAAKTLPRMMLHRIIKDFNDLPEGTFARGDIPINNLLKAIELHAKKYEGMGSKQTIVHEGSLAYEAVESKPIIIERPQE